jgi:hypothetical protein
MGIQELLARRPRPAPKQKINVVGGVLVYAFYSVVYACMYNFFNVPDFYTGPLLSTFVYKVYCDPKTWPENPEKLNLPEGWFVAVGVHPKHALDFDDFY